VKRRADSAGPAAAVAGANEARVDAAP
jgi:hypothetical protein